MNKKIIYVPIAAVALTLLSVSPALAHVVVRPNQVGVGERVNFVVSVPTEEDDPTVQMRLVIPEGLQSVRPNVKPGWSIQLKKTSEGEDAKVAEITWSGGRIPAEQRDEFVFSAQAPKETTTLAWKAYQTYDDGDVVAWENDPKVVEEYTKNKQATASGSQNSKGDDHNAPRPFSVTKVVDDLSKAPAGTTTQSEGTQTVVQGQSSGMTNVIAYAALLLGAVSLALTLKDKMRPKPQV